MKNFLLDKLKRQIAPALRLPSPRGKAALTRALAAVSVVLTMATFAFLRGTFSTSFSAAASTRAAPTASVSPSPAPSPSATPVKQQRVISMPLKGYVDLHTHPMSHLGFGKKLVHGAPDIGSIVPKGTHDCNSADFRAKTMGEALGSCSSTHGGWGIDNGCGDHLRAAFINLGIDDGFKYKLPPEQNLHGDHQHAGYPEFKYWPHQTSKLHQQMWYEWIKRAHDGGLRVMVALSVNSQLLAGAINGDSPTSDVGSSDLQIKEITSFVGRHNDFMEIAKSSEDLRRIISSGKLAVILGMEIDDFGGFNYSYIYGMQPEIGKQAMVKAEIKRVYDLGVRYIFPVHLTNNALGGTAVYNMMFNFANKHNTGSLIVAQHTSDASINYDMNFVGGGPVGLNNAIMLGLRTQLDLVGEMVAPCINDISCLPGGKVRCCSPALGIIKKAMTIDDPQWQFYEQMTPGHINNDGLSSVGEYAIKEMMKLGMIIDLDHMGIKSMKRSLEIAEAFGGGYPVNLGHNGMRKSGPSEGTERNVDAATALRVGKLGGMFGLGTADLTADEFIAEYRKVVKAMGNNGAINVAPGVGTDANGLEPLPKGSSGLNSATFYTADYPKSKTGQRTWDYTKEGVAHYGLMNEFMRDVKNRTNGQEVHDKLWSSAEAFAKMWEKCEDRSNGQ